MVTTEKKVWPIKLMMNHRCGWRRELSQDPFWLSRKTVSPVYGEVTMEQLAELDVINHNCQEYEFAVERARASAQVFRSRYPAGWSREVA